MAQVTHVIGIRKLPDQGIVFSHDSRRAGLDTVRAIDVVSTLYAVVWATSCAGYIHGLGQAFWMALYALGILHKLPWLAFQNVALLYTFFATADVLAGHAVSGLWAPAAL